jgi:hypothetical protein
LAGRARRALAAGPAPELSTVAVDNSGTLLLERAILSPVALANRAAGKIGESLISAGITHQKN